MQKLLAHAEFARIAEEQTPTDANTSATHSIIFRIGVTLAHELCHIFVGYLLCNPRAQTPPDVTFGPGYGNDTQGEAGRFWEHVFFGLYVDMQMKPDGASVALKGYDTNTVYVITKEAINCFIYRGTIAFFYLFLFYLS